MSENSYLKWLSSDTLSVYWHDSADISELKNAISNGAVSATTNPFLVNQTLLNNPASWTKELSDLPDGLEGDDKAEALIGCVTAKVAGELRRFLDVEKGKGLCCVQVNPNKPGDTLAMIEQAKRYLGIAKNVVIKLPATRAGLEAYEECAALGMNVAATVSFTVAQTLMAGAAYERGVERAIASGIKPGLGIAVLMVGRLDDYLRDVASDTRCKAREEDIIQSGIAAIKRSYEIFNERKYRSFLMPAAYRGVYHVTALAGARMLMSIAPSIAEMLRVADPTHEEGIEKPGDPNVIDRLMTMKEFRKAYEPDGMTADEFITYGSTNRTLTQFCIAGWDGLASYKL